MARHTPSAARPPPPHFDEQHGQRDGDATWRSSTWSAAVGRVGVVLGVARKSSRPNRCRPGRPRAPGPAASSSRRRPARRRRDRGGRAPVSRAPRSSRHCASGRAPARRTGR
jgi:hypothetical protein